VHTQQNGADMKNIRKDFPILQQTVNGSPLIYFDNAATTQKPECVIAAMTDFYRTQNANIYRGVYTLTEQATSAYEQARATVAAFIGAADASEIVFTHGTTESINCVASGWAMEHLQAGDEIVITELEHHANMIPWQQVAEKKGILLRYIPVTPEGILDLTQLPTLISANTKLVAVTHVSNALGTHNDVATIIKAAHAVGAQVLVDAAQSVAHQPLNVQELGADFVAFSGHKMLGPTGIGILYVNKRLHDQMPPVQFGGGMVYHVTSHHATWQKMPYRLEAGTPAIAQALGLAAAIQYIQNNIPFDALKKHEAALCTHFIEGLEHCDRVRILGPINQLKEQGHIVSFTVEGMHPHDIATFLDQYGICVRAGHHCAQPLAQKLGIESSVRVSFYAYNTHEEVARVLEVLRKLLA
jgi:cysteine desulfurase/selenocysteine lyase